MVGTLDNLDTGAQAGMGQLWSLQELSLQLGFGSHSCKEGNLGTRDVVVVVLGEQLGHL